MDDTDYRSKAQVLEAAKKVLGHSLRGLIPAQDVPIIEKSLLRYGTNRKGYFGDLIEQYVFGIKNNSRSEADFQLAGVELKSTPLKEHRTKKYVAKERLVFSMIDYDNVINETWERSTFLQKNKLLLILFYLYLERQSLLDYDFKFVHLLDLLNDIDEQDVEQIRRDWQFIVEKIRRGEAHLLSEADTYYLGACTKAKNSSVVRDQPRARIPAKPRAFSLKQSYLNYLIQKQLLGRPIDAVSVYRGIPRTKPLEAVIRERLAPFIGKSEDDIIKALAWTPVRSPKNIRRLLVNRMLTGGGGNRVEELEKSNVTLKVLTLESSGNLTESISFPAFDYKDLLSQNWYDEESEYMSDFHSQLETRKFLFVIFQKNNTGRGVLQGFRFWNFPMSDLGEAERVFERTKECIASGRYGDLPKMSDSKVAHVRPHGRDADDTLVTPQGTHEVKRCFWLNAKYIQQAIESAGDQA